MNCFSRRLISSTLVPEPAAMRRLRDELIEEPLDRRWLQRAGRSTSAEPMWEPAYRQAPLAPQTWEKLQQHPQFG